MTNNELLDIILNHEKLIYAIINKMKGKYDQEDLYQVGVIGLIKAYRNYNASYGVKFSTYAFSYILGEIKKYIRENKGIKISRDLFRLSSKIERAQDLLSQKLMRIPTVKELSIYLEIDEDRITEALNIHNYIQSLDIPINDDGKELTLYDSIQQEEDINLLDKIYLDEEVAKLPIEEQAIVHLRYKEDQTQMETATFLGLTQVQVSRREQKVLTKLRGIIV